MNSNAPAFRERIHRRRYLRGALPPLLLLGFLLPAAAKEVEVPVSDPMESLNRKAQSFNDGIDKYILGPIARGWIKITPEILRDSLLNFDDNLRFPVIVSNDILQWKWRAAGQQTARFAINTTVGILGFRDQARQWGFAKQNEDTGQTFGVWGIPAGPYLVLPLLGPSNPRDVVGLVADSFLSVYWIFVPFYASAGYRSVDVVNRRAVFDDEVENSRKAALDYYVFLRNAYGQNRDAMIRDMSEAESDEDLYEIDSDLYEVDDEDND